MNLLPRPRLRSAQCRWTSRPPVTTPGSLLLRSGDLATAPKNYQKAVTIAEALSGADASDRRELSGYAIALMRVENLIPEDGDNPKALAAFSKSIGIMERLADRYPIAGTCEKSIALGEAPVKADAKDIENRRLPEDTYRQYKKA